MTKLLQAWFGDQARGCLIYLIAAAIVIPLACGLIFVPLALVQNNRQWNTTTEMLVLLIPMSCFLLLILGGSLGFAWWTFRSRAQWLDAAFVPLGTQGSGYLLSGRQYHGTFTRRPLDIYFMRGPLVQIFLGTSLKTRLGVGAANALSRFGAGLMNRIVIETGASELQGLTISALDENWARQLLAEPHIRQIIRQLLTPPEPALLRTLILQPGAWHLQLYRNAGLFSYTIAPELAQQLARDLAELARLAEELPAPTQTAEASALENPNRTARGTLNMRIIVIVLGVVGLMTICAVALTAVIVFLTSR